MNLISHYSSGSCLFYFFISIKLVCIHYVHPYSFLVCLHVNKHVKLLFYVIYVDIFPGEPLPQITVVFFRTVKKY